jgi:hypothetical protein
LLATTRQRILTSGPFPNSHFRVEFFESYSSVVTVTVTVMLCEASLCIGVTVLRVQSRLVLFRSLIDEIQYPFELKHVRLIKENRTRYKPRVGCQNPLDMNKLWTGQEQTYVVQEQKNVVRGLKLSRQLPTLIEIKKYNKYFKTK